MAPASEFAVNAKQPRASGVPPAQGVDLVVVGGDDEVGSGSELKAMFQLLQPRPVVVFAQARTQRRPGDAAAALVTTGFHARVF